MNEKRTAPSIPVSWGELIDKITILEIKAERLTEAAARANVRHELEQLSKYAGAAAGLELVRLKEALKKINQELWRIEDEIRLKEAAKSFDADFIALARAVYRANDERGRIKREINMFLKSDLIEEKQYSAY